MTGVAGSHHSSNGQVCVLLSLWPGSVQADHVLSVPQQWFYFEIWKWCFFFAGIAPIQFIGHFLVHIIFLCAESQFFTLRHALYFAVSIKVLCFDPLEVSAVFISSNRDLPAEFTSDKEKSVDRQSSLLVVVCRSYCLY